MTVEAREEPLVAQVIAERLQAVLKSEFDAREWRMSESGACPRRRVMRVLGYEAEPFSEETAAYFERGNVMEDWLVEQFRRQFPRRVRTQVEVLGPGCRGHIDIFLLGEHRFVEVKTANDAAEAYGLPKTEHLLQVQAYHHFGRRYGVVVDGRERKLPDDTVAEIVYLLLGRELRFRAFPVRYSPQQGASIERELLHLQELASRGEVPPMPGEYAADRFPCSWRNGQVRCPFYRHCWQDEAVATAPVLIEGAEDLFRSYAALRREYGKASAVQRELKGQLDELEAQLDALFAARGVERGALSAGGVQISRAPVAGRVTYDVEAAALAGAVDLEALAPWRKESGGYVRWTVKEAN